MRLITAPWLCSALIFLACGDNTPSSAESGAGTFTSTPGAADGSSDDGPTTAGEASMSAGDTSMSGGLTGGMGGSCPKIDFLFVVDNSASMSEEQQSLVNSFDGFITAIQDTVMAVDYHLMVVDTDGVPMADCDATLGSGLVNDPLGQACGVVGGHRYTVDGQPDLSATFACLALVGTAGDGTERTMEAMIAAITSLNGAGACNEGFLREDALLVVTFITDEEDDEESNGDPAGWNAALVAAKVGAEKSIVVLGLIGDPDQADPVCTADTAEASPRLREFAESFTFGSWGSICSPDYAPFFADAVSVIDSACEQFEPSG